VGGFYATRRKQPSRLARYFKQLAIAFRLGLSEHEIAENRRAADGFGAV
jgi:hypothetical protein